MEKKAETIRQAVSMAVSKYEKFDARRPGAERSQSIERLIDRMVDQWADHLADRRLARNYNSREI